MTDEAAIRELMRRNVLEVFGQRDRAARRAAIAGLYAPDVRFVDDDGSVTGHDAIDDAVERVLTSFPQLSFAVATPPSAVGDLGRVTWELRTADGVARARGMDLATVADGRITRMWTFLDPLLGAAQ
jgi:ketosteroid isomerase-like protein